MTQGKSSRVTIRIPTSLLVAIEAHVERSKQSRRTEPFTQSSFIIAAVVEKLRHYERSNSGRSTVPLTVNQIVVSEEHRSAAYEAGFAWACDCPECEAARRAAQTEENVQ